MLVVDVPLSRWNQRPRDVRRDATLESSTASDVAAAVRKRVILGPIAALLRVAASSILTQFVIVRHVVVS